MAAAVAYAVVLIWPISDLIAAHDVGAIAGPQRAAHLQTAREAARTLLVITSVGFAVAGGLLVVASNYVAARRVAEVAGQGEVTERYGKAIEQLGAGKIEVRIGGIYALQRIARDSAQDRPNVMAVLAAFIREHSRAPWPPSGATGASKPPGAAERATRPDVQAAVTVIGLRDAGRAGTSRISLGGVSLMAADLRSAKLANANLRGATLARADAVDADLAGADLSGADLSGADLTGANVAGANLPGARLANAFLPGADLTEAQLQRADLTGAALTAANLTDAKLTRAKLARAELIETNLTGAQLSGTDLSSANLTNTVLAGADLSEADLRGATLAGANLTGADLSGAWYPAEAEVPAGWERSPGSGRLARIPLTPAGAGQDG
jgi:uncharacterized protein YjbI with pentapeptide repeats